MVLLRNFHAVLVVVGIEGDRLGGKDVPDVYRGRTLVSLPLSTRHMIEDFSNRGWCRNRERQDNRIGKPGDRKVAGLDAEQGRLQMDRVGIPRGRAGAGVDESGGVQSR